MSRYVRWTADDVEKLKALSKDHTFEELAETFNRPVEAIRQKCRTLAIRKATSSKRSSLDRERLLCFYRENGLKKTCEHYSLTRHTVGSIVRREKQKESDIASGVKVESAERLRHMAIKYAYNFGQAENAQDFASYCVIRKYEGRAKQDLRHIFVDYVRETFGDKRASTSRARYLDYKNPRIIGEAPGDATGNTIYIDLPSENDYIARFETINAIKLDGDHRTCFVLHAVFGLTSREIALCLGVTESRISQILSEAEKKLRALHNNVDCA